VVKNSILSASTKVCIVVVFTILHRHDDRIACFATLVEIIHLEVERLFRETVSIGDIVDFINNIECIDPGRVRILASCGLFGGVVGVFEHQTISILWGRVWNFFNERDNIVSSKNIE